MTRASYRGKDMCDLTDEELEDAKLFMNRWAGGFLTKDAEGNALNVLSDFDKEYNYEKERRLKAKMNAIGGKNV